MVCGCSKVDQGRDHGASQGKDKDAWMCSSLLRKKCVVQEIVSPYSVSFVAGLLKNTELESIECD